MNKDGHHQISNVYFHAGVSQKATDSQEALFMPPWLAPLTPHPHTYSPFMQKHAFLTLHASNLQLSSLLLKADILSPLKNMLG